METIARIWEITLFWLGLNSLSVIIGFIYMSVHKLNYKLLVKYIYIYLKNYLICFVISSLMKLQASKFLMEIVELHVDIKELLQGTFTPRLEQINCAIQVLLPIRAEKCIHHVPGNDCLLLVHHNSLSCRRVFHSIFCDLLKMQIQFPI